MADAQRTIELIFKGVDQTGAAIDSVLRGTSSFASGVQSATQPIADFTVGALKLEAGLLAAGAAFTTVSVIAAGQFDSAFREIDTLVDAPVEALGSLRSELLEYASSSTQSLESITGATYSAISAGVDYTDSVRALASAEQLAVAGRANLNDSMVLLVSTLNAYGQGMDSASRYSDILFNTVRLGQTTLPELSASLSNVTGTAATLGVPFETLTAALAALTTVGIPTAQATTALNAALSALIAPSAQAKTIAQELGLEFSAQAVRAQGLEGVLQTVYAATGGNEEQMRRLFGSTEALRAVLPLTGAAAESFAGNLVAMQNNAGATAAAYAEMANSFDVVNQRVANAFQVMLIQIGDPLLDEYGGLADAIANIFRTIGIEADGGVLESLVSYVESQLGELEQIFQRIAANLPEALQQADLSGFTDGVDELKNAFGLLFDGIDITTVDGLTRAIEFAGESFHRLSAFVAGVVESFEPMVDKLSDMALKISELPPELLNAAGQVAGFATQANILAGTIQSLLPSLESLATIVGMNQAAGLVGSFRGAATALAGGTGLVALLGQAGLVAAAGAASYAIGSLLAPKIDDVVNSFTEGEHSLGTWIYQLVNGAEEAELMAQVLAPVPVAIDDITRAAQGVDLSALLIPDDQLTRNASSIAMISREYEAMRASIDNLLIPQSEVNRVISEQEAAINSLMVPQEQLTRSVDDWSQATVGIVPIYDQITGAIIGYEEGIIAAGSAQERANAGIVDRINNINVLTGATVRATDATAEMAAISAEFAQEYALEALRGNVEIRVAEIEAGARRIESAFDSINVSIESTGDLIGTALGLLADTDTSLRGRFDIERQLDIENQRRGEALGLQEELTRATIRQLDAQAQSLARGDGIITINGDGLAPHLEAMMWEVLRSVQVRVNEDGMAMLLGVGATEVPA
ncbi:MAG: phage tail tape measure protein [Porticoccaceae bacterium]